MLAKLSDPVFLGFAEAQKQPISTQYKIIILFIVMHLKACKFVSKRNAEEKVGVHVFKGGRP